ncbi:MAG: phenylalanine--tRNA ligase subunit beta, partial [Rhodothermales bacterium]
LDVFSGGERLGVVAQLAEEFAGENDLDDPVLFCELDWSAVVRLAAPFIDATYRPVSRYPTVHRDIAVVVDQSREAGVLMDAIRRSAGELLLEVDLFDLYQGEHVDEGRKSLAFALRFGTSRTLTDEEVDERVDAVVRTLESEFDARLRS